MLVCDVSMTLAAKDLLVDVCLYVCVYGGSSLDSNQGN